MHIQRLQILELARGDAHHLRQIGLTSNLFAPMHGGLRLAITAIDADVMQALHFLDDRRLLEMVGVDAPALADVGFNEAAENSVSNRKTFLYRPYAAGALLSLLMWF